MRASSASRGPGEPSRAPGRGVVLLLVGLAAALRVYPLHVFFLHPDQEWIPSMAMRSILEHSWRPEMLTYPSALMETLRVCYLGIYIAGRALGAFADRVDLAAAAVSHPLAFLLAGRLWSCLLGTATVPVIAWLGTLASLGIGCGIRSPRGRRGPDGAMGTRRSVSTTAPSATSHRAWGTGTAGHGGYVSAWSESSGAAAAYLVPE